MQLRSWKSCLAELETALNIGTGCSPSLSTDMVMGRDIICLEVVNEYEVLLDEMFDCWGFGWWEKVQLVCL